MATLAELRGRVKQVLADTTSAIWSDTWLDEGIRQALHEYSLVRPRRAVITITLSADGREIDISSVSDLLAVSEVWLPYTAADPEYPPNVRNFAHWRDSGLLYLPDGSEPQAGDVARIFYTAMQTIQDLDSATATTIPTEHESILVNGAAGHVAASRAIDLMEQVTIDRLTAQQVRAWGLSKLQEFRVALRAVAREGAQGSAFVALPKIDKYDSEWR